MSRRNDHMHYTEVTYSGRKLLERNKIGDVGTWQIKGEDPNADFGGHHHQPDLGIYSGTLGDCIKYAVALPNFWTWGGGGSISKVEVVTTRDAEAVANFCKRGAALAKLTAEEIKLLGIEDQI